MTVPVLETSESANTGARLLLSGHPIYNRKWLARCVERLTFDDHETITRRLTMDVRVREDGVVARVGDLLLLPLVRLPTGHHTSFSAYDESGATLPRLTRGEERRLVIEGLLDLAQSGLRQAQPALDVADLSNEVKAAIVRIANHESEPSELAATGDEGSALSQISWFVDALRHAHRYFYLVVVLDQPVPSPSKRRKGESAPQSEQVSRAGAALARDEVRRVITVAYKSQARAEPSPVEVSRKLSKSQQQRMRLAGVQDAGRLRASTVWDKLVGAWGVDYAITVGQRVSECESYHCEMQAPHDVRVVGACLSMESEGQYNLAVDDDTSTATAHMHVTRARDVNQAHAVARLIPVTTGVMRTSWLSSGFISFILMLGTVSAWAFPEQVTSLDADSAVALLLLAPGALAAALAGPSGHSLTTRLNFDARLSVIVNCILIFSAAVTVALDISAASVLRLLWTTLFTASAMITLRLLLMRQRLNAAVALDDVVAREQ